MNETNADLVKTISGIIRLYANKNENVLDEFYDSISSDAGSKKRKPFTGVTAQQIAFELSSKYKNSFPSLYATQVHQLIRDNEELLHLARSGFVAVVQPGRKPCWYDLLTDEEKKDVPAATRKNHFPLSTKEPMVPDVITGKLVPISKAVESKDWETVRRELHRQQHEAFYSRFTTVKAVNLSNEDITNSVLYRVQQTNIITTLNTEKIEFQTKNASLLDLTKGLQNLLNKLASEKTEEA